ncbi:hypothetical protein HYDPIDRAFT_107615 [Hydnomerulius pinastri MD-312]|nr:hypothetical protein HYDPIDRAFT_107615 [Hydnomerulius pinastri MD-312]
MFSSSPRSASPPPTIPFKFRRKSSSASTSVPFDKYAYSQERDTASPLSPLPSSSPLLTPLHAGRRQEYEGGKYGAYDYANDGLCDPLCDFEAVRDPWSHYTRRGNASPFPVHHPLPSLITKFGSCAPRDEVPLFFPESPPSPHNPRMTSHLYSAEDSAIIDDDHEEYDLESMDIHVRETYFATSAERGRWMSSPIAPRKRTQAAAFVSSPIRPMRGHSTPVKNVGTNGLRNAFELQERARRQSTNSIADTDFLSSSFFDENDDEREHSRYSSPLPPSSPLTSPMSIGPSLSDDWHFEDGMAVDESTSHPDVRLSLCGMQSTTDPHCYLIFTHIAR